jgi:hypothetical protein
MKKHAKQIVKFHTPNADEDPKQVYALLEIKLDEDDYSKSKADILALNTNFSFPPIMTVLLSDLVLAVSYHIKKISSITTDEETLMRDIESEQSAIANLEALRKSVLKANKDNKYVTDIDVWSFSVLSSIDKTSEVISVYTICAFEI